MTHRPTLHWTRQSAATALAQTHIAADWDRLNAQRGHLPFLDAGAMSNALAVFGQGQEQLLIASDDSRSCAMFVLAPHGALRWQTFQPSQVPLGAWVAEATLPLELLVDSLIRGPLGLCLVLSVTQVDPRFAERAQDTATLRLADYIDTGWLPINGKFEEYWAARGKNLRQNMRKQRNKLQADGVATHMRALRDQADMAPALERYGALESAGWKSGEGTAIHSGNAQGHYYRRLFEEAAARGEAVIYEYLFDQRTVAMNLCLLRDGQLIVLKTAYDETIKSLSPAFLLREEELQTFYGNNEVRRIEYYGKLMDWHTKLTNEKRTLYHLTRYRWPWVKRLAARRAQQSEGNVSKPVPMPEASQLTSEAPA